MILEVLYWIPQSAPALAGVDNQGHYSSLTTIGLEHDCGYHRSLDTIRTSASVIRGISFEPSYLDLLCYT